MTFKKILIRIIKTPVFYVPLLFTLSAHASFIETTVGTAVVNDATASYYNPAALVLIKNPQIIPQVTVADFNTHFSGQSTPVSTGITQNGSASTNTDYYSPSFYFGAPITNRITAGLAVVSNAGYRNADDNSILRYVQGSNTIQDYDAVPAVAIRINKFFSIGGGVNFSTANFDLRPITRFPGATSEDSQSNNQASGTGIGENVGFLLQPNAATLIGFNYRSKTTYALSGKSVFEGTSRVVSDNYHFDLVTPARSVLSINHFVTKKLGFITTIARIEWSAITNVNIYGIANAIDGNPVIVNASIPYYLRDTWAATLGSHYHITPKWILRVASSYNQSPSNPHYQIANGDSIILGASMGYQINKTITIDGSYAHAFIENENINITGGRYLIQGINSGSRDAVSVKLTVNV